MIRRRILHALSLPLVLLLSLVMVPLAQAQEDSWIDEYVLSGSSEPFFVGGDYAWGLQQISPWFDPAAEPVTLTFDWGDGTTTVATSAEDVECYSNGEGQWQCWTWVGHIYAEQGLFSITATAQQDGSPDCSASTEAIVYDLDSGGSVRASGTLEARVGGMYDQGFQSGPMTFSLTASRRDGSSSSKAALKVSVPDMEPDWPAEGECHGMTFTSKATTRPLYVQELPGRGAYEVFIERIFGTVTNSCGSAGTGYAQFHATVAKGQPTLARIQVWNTSAGFTYVDTAKPPENPDGPWQGYLVLESTDGLLTGSVRVS